MVRIAWVHDHRFYQGNDGEYYSKSGVNEKALTRYLRYFEEILVVGREGTTESSSGMSKISCDRVSFDLIPGVDKAYYFVIKRRKIYRHLRQRIMSSDACLVLLPSQLGSMAIQVCEDLGKPYVVQAIGCAWDSLWNHGSLVGRMVASISFLRMRRAIKKAPYVTYITEKFLQRRYPTSGLRGDAIPNVIIEVADESVLRRRIASLADRTDRPARIGLIGSLDVDYKGHDIALRSLAELDDIKPHPELHFLGPGSVDRWSSMARALGVEEYVHFDSVMPSSDVPKWLDDLDVYIQPSTAEGHGRAVVEAMSRGCATFGSNVGGISDSLAGDYLFEPNNYDALASLIRRAISDSKFSQEAAQRNFEASQRFSPSVIEDRRDEFFGEFLAREFPDRRSYRQGK